MNFLVTLMLFVLATVASAVPFGYDPYSYGQGFGGPGYYRPEPDYYRPGPDYYRPGPDYYRPGPDYYRPGPDYYRPNYYNNYGGYNQYPNQGSDASASAQASASSNGFGK